MRRVLGRGDGFEVWEKEGGWGLGYRSQKGGKGWDLAMALVFCLHSSLLFLQTLFLFLLYFGSFTGDFVPSKLIELGRLAWGVVLLRKKI